MELTNYEIVRYPSGQIVITGIPLNPQGTPSGGPRDVVGSYTNEAEAQSALQHLLAAAETRRAA